MSDGTAGPATVWWRADRYEIMHGTHIRPVTDREVGPYDTLARYNEFWIGEGSARDAYLALLNLDLDDNDAILNWCSRFGLLGILHHRLVAAYFWPTWEPRLLGRLEQLKPHQTILAEAESFNLFRTRVQINEVASVPNEEPRDEGRPLSESELLEALDPGKPFSLRPPHVLVRDIGTSDLYDVDIVEGYGQFFPDVDGIPAWTKRQATEQEGFPWAPPSGNGDPPLRGMRPRAELNQASYPLPDSDDFRGRYAEPRHLFHQVVHGFRAAVRSLSDQAENERAIRPAVMLYGHHVPTQLAAALRQVSPSLAWSDKDGWAHAWEVRSLLAAMSVMVVQDLTLKRGRLLTCPQCSGRFFTDRSDAKYCKPECGNRFRVAKHRAKTDAAEDPTSRKEDQEP